ncbi:Fic family protein [Fusobacterium varium]|uniref:Fic family protein n=1 Tax=Fusobacterium varium TaxID=856 RepID=UPI002430F2BD|nr:cell filamentation protein Fic [Fusobacterium varium]
MEDKYNLTREQNIFLAKKILAETVYNAIKLEGLNTTYVQTEKILNGINDEKVALDDVRTILNLKSAWKYILNNLDKEIDINFVCNVNKRVSADESLDWGVIRYGNVGVRLIDGSSYDPEVPDIEKVTKELEKINKIENTTEKALTYYLWGARSQLFWDGNKRTSNIVANAILIKGGKGILSVDEKDLEEFNLKLSKFYKTNNMKEMKDFLYNKSIKGMTINKELEKKNKNPWTKSKENEKNKGNER